MNIQREVLNCPACGSAIVGTFSTEVRMADDQLQTGDGHVNVSASITGMRLEHACIPPQKRTR